MPPVDVAEPPEYAGPPEPEAAPPDTLVGVVVLPTFPPSYILAPEFEGAPPSIILAPEFEDTPPSIYGSVGGRGEPNTFPPGILSLECLAFETLILLKGAKLDFPADGKKTLSPVAVYSG